MVRIERLVDGDDDGFHRVDTMNVEVAEPGVGRVRIQFITDTSTDGRATLAPTSELRVPVASLDDIVESKTHADRARDREAVRKGP